MKSENTDKSHPQTLVVDLDGTLLRSDMLFESFWSAFSRDWRTPFLSVIALKDGRVTLKRLLATIPTVNAETLPYDTSVLEYIEAWRRSGGKTALVTASNRDFAKSIASHLGVFDEFHGSDGETNLKGEQKARFLEERFGPKGFAYMGDAAADLPVWACAAKAITVNASPALRHQVEAKSEGEVEHLITEDKSVRPYITALRSHQWLKNLLVFLPMLAGHQFDGATVLMSIMAFICFSMVASSVYVLNDLLDLATDRTHPRKRNRPFASGSIPIAHGTWMAVLLLILGMLLAAGIGGNFLLVMAGYYLLSTAYSLNLKRRMVVDICVLAGLYTVRILAGGVATDITLSAWLLAFSVFFFLSMASVKRQAELIDIANRGIMTTSGRGYHIDDLPIISMISVGAGYGSVLIMTLYINSPEIMNMYARPDALWGVCAVLLYWITRTVMIAHRGGMHDDPVVYATKDRISWICLLIIFAFVFTALGLNFSGLDFVSNGFGFVFTGTLA